jgi:hypothetical protein
MEQSRHGEGVTSIKVHHQPGGNQSFNIFGGSNEPMQQSAKQIANNAAAVAPPVQNQNQNQNQAVDAAGIPVVTSVRVHAPPGGKSSISFC